MEETKQSGSVYCLIMQDVLMGKSKETDVPDVVKPLLAEFKDLIPDELPDGLPLIA